VRTILNQVKRVGVLGGRWVLGVVLGLACRDSSGAVPTLTGVTPFGLNPGETVAVKVNGKLDGRQRRVWSEDPGLVMTAPDASGQAWLRVAPEVGMGVHWIRLVNAEGVSAPVRVQVGKFPRVEEKEPNDEVASPQAIGKLPAWIQGQLERTGDVDGYALKLRRGVPVFIRADAYELGSAVDLHLNLLDARGERVAMATDGRNLDPWMTYTAPEDGVYVLQVAGFEHPPTSNVFLAGGVKCPYLISVTDEPVATRVFPAVVPLEGSVEGMVRGPGLKGSAEKVRLDASMVRRCGELGAVWPKGSVTPLNVVCSRFPVRWPKGREEGQPPIMEVPGVVGGELAVGAKTSEWSVKMSKGQKLQARLWSRSLGLGLEGELSVRGPSGEVVASNPNPADVFAEPVVNWTASVEGEYRVVIRDLFGRVGEGREYVLEVAAPEPACAVELVAVKPLVVAAGKSVSQKVKVTLNGGWKEPLVVRVGGLPEGVFAGEVPVPEKGGELEVSLQAADNAEPVTALAHVSVWTKTEPPRWVGGQYLSRGELHRGFSDSDFSRELWVSVVPKVAVKPGEGASK
jgi:hypothetical protein